MRIAVAALGLGLASIVAGIVDGFVVPAGRFVDVVPSSRSESLHRAGVVGDRSRLGLRGLSGRNPVSTLSRDGGARQTSTAGVTTTALSARAGRGPEEGGQKDGPSSAAAMSGVGSVGSNVLLLVASVMVVKGLLLPENVRHLGFCPTEDPIRGRDTLPWRMMIESGRECGTIPEVIFKYVTAPLAFPGTPEWGMMLNTKEDLAKDAWLQ
ncbi:unnamed protein product [Ectocarpus sp. 12 AP-2014]